MIGTAGRRHYAPTGNIEQEGAPMGQPDGTTEGADAAPGAEAAARIAGGYAFDGPAVELGALVATYIVLALFTLYE